MADAPAEARVGDPVTHSAALWGLLEGALLGAALGVILIGTGGAAAPLVIAGAAATGASVGGAVGKLWGSTQVVPCGVILTGSPNVSVNGKPAAFVGSLVSCSQHGGPQTIVEGSGNVEINGRRAARVGDRCSCGCVIAPAGSPDVAVGGPAVMPAGAAAAEVPWYADAGLFVLGMVGGGALLKVGGLGAGAIAARLGGSLFGSELGGAGGRALGGELFGEGSTGQTVLGVAGSLVGGLGGDVAGGAGAGAAARAAEQAAIRERVLANVAASRAARLADPEGVMGNAANAQRTATVAADGTVGAIDYGRNFDADVRNFTPGTAVSHSGPLPDDLVLVNYHNADAPIGYFPGQSSRSLMWWTPATDANGFANEAAVRDGLALPTGWGARDGAAVARIPAGTDVTFYRGEAVGQTDVDAVTGAVEARPGGGTQYRFRAFDPAWIVDSRRIP